MASRIWHVLLEQRLLLLLHLAVTLTRLRSADAGHSPPIVYHRLVGENVTFYCPVAQESQLKFLYFQKYVSGEPIFFNGYHSLKHIHNQRPNTEMDQNHTQMHIYGLNLTDSGEYHCYYMYKDTASDDFIKIQIYLNVTAFFSKPEITVKCKEESGVPSDCNVTCHSHNGLSGKRMEWNVTGNINREMWKVLLNDESPSRDELVSISSTANFNCSVDEVKVSCSVDGFTSETVSASPCFVEKHTSSNEAFEHRRPQLRLQCPSKIPPGPFYKFSDAVIVAAVFCSLFVFGLLLFWWLRNRTTGTDKGSVERNNVEEVIVLNSIR